MVQCIAALPSSSSRPRQPPLGASSIPLLAQAARVGAPEPVEPGAGAWRTWFLKSGADLRPSPPPDSQSELSQVRGALGAVDAAMVDQIAFWDAGAPPYRWNELATGMSFRGAFGTSSPAIYPRIQAYLNMAIHDATVATWTPSTRTTDPDPANWIRQ
jgi:hypothetical protein